MTGTTAPTNRRPAPSNWRRLDSDANGGSGIRTRETPKGLPVFKPGAPTGPASDSGQGKNPNDSGDSANDEGGESGALDARLRSILRTGGSRRDLIGFAAGLTDDDADKALRWLRTALREGLL